MSSTHLAPAVPVLSKYRVAAIQYEPALGQKEKNVGDLLRLLEEAAQHEARLIVLPVMATTGYCWDSRDEIAPPVPTTDRLQRLAVSDGFSRVGLLVDEGSATDGF